MLSHRHFSECQCYGGLSLPESPTLEVSEVSNQKKTNSLSCSLEHERGLADQKKNTPKSTHKTYRLALNSLLT